MGRAGGEGCGTIAVGESSDGKRPMQRNDLSRSLVAFERTRTVVAVVELSLKNWLVSGLVPGVKRQPLKKLAAARERLLALLERWRDEAIKAAYFFLKQKTAYEITV